MSSTKNYLVTGANSGLGLDTSRQLALLPTTKMVFLACRSETKAQKAIDDLVLYAHVPKSKIAYVHFDASASKENIERIIQELPTGEPIDGLILNAGGMVSLLGRSAANRSLETHDSLTL